MKGNLKLFRKRLALLLAVALTIGSISPVWAGEIPANADLTGAGETGGTVNAEKEPDEGSPAASENLLEDLTSPDSQTVPDAQTAPEDQTVSEGEAGKDPSRTVSDDGTVSEDTVSANVSQNLFANENVSEDEASRGGPLSADATIMYYMVGSNLEGNNAEATRDIVEIMTGLQWAEKSPLSKNNASVNVIMETGGVSDKTMEAGGVHEKALKNLEQYFGQGGQGASENDLKTLKILEGKNIKWNKNERWVISGESLIPAANNEGIQADRVMTGIKSGEGAGTAPELIDFIKTTVQEYPARNYMLVLWDHGGGPKGGFGGDDRGGKESSYITSDQLTRSLSEAGIGQKFSFIGFDACLMGNLETAMALEPYADLMFASEDLEPGTGWDHRGYVQEMVYPYTASQGKNPGSLAYTPELIDLTVRGIGQKLVEDNTKYYNAIDVSSTMSVVSLDAVSFNLLNTALSDLAARISADLIVSGNKFSRDGYLNLMEAAEGAVRFNSVNDGIIDIYSLCGMLKNKFGDESGVGQKAQVLADLIKPRDHDDSRINEGLVLIQQYSKKYYFAKKEEEDFNALGGLTFFLPYSGGRFTYEDGGKSETFDSLKDYLDIYKKVQHSPGLAKGYTDLLKAFCSAQAIGNVLCNTYDKSPSEISDKMKKEAEGIIKDYDPLEAYIKSMMDNMADVNGDIIRGRISSNDMHMKTCVSEDGSLYYALDLDGEKKNLIKKIRQEPVFKNNAGKSFRLGCVPAARDPYVLSNGRYRFEIQNRKERKWFSINGYPAAVLSVRNMTDITKQDYFDPFGETHIKVQFPAMMVKSDSKNFYEVVAIEVEFESTSMNDVEPEGYYLVDSDSKQMTGFVPWSDVADDTSFALISDMGEYFDNSYNNYDTENANNNCYTMYIDKNSNVNGRLLASRNLTFEEEIENMTKGEYVSEGIGYMAKDIFSGDYGIDDLREGENAMAFITLSGDSSKMSEDEKKEGITYISQNRSDIYPVVSFMVNSDEAYTLSFNGDSAPRTGYLEDEGAFHPLTKSSEFAALDPGVYRLVFEGYDADSDKILIDGKTMLSINGCVESIPASNYTFYPGVNNTVLTVGNKDGGLTIEYASKSHDLPYGFYQTLNPYEDMRNFVTVKNGGGDVTASARMLFEISANGKSYNIFVDKDLKAFKELKLKLGDVISVNASFRVGEGTEAEDFLFTKEPLELTIGRQPVMICATKEYETRLHDEETLFWKKGAMGDHDSDVKIMLQFGGNLYQDRTWGKYIGQEMGIDSLLSEKGPRAIYIDTDSVEGHGTFNNLRLGPDDGRERAGYFKDEDFKADFSEYLYLESFEDAKLFTYKVLPASLISFRSLKDDTVLAEDYIKLASDFEGIVPNYKVSEGAIRISGNTVKQWYARIGNRKRFPVFLDGKEVPYKESADDEESTLNMAISNDSADEWDFRIPMSASTDRVCFYADYEEKVSDFKETGSKTFNITADPVEPVEYTGKALVTTTSGKTGSRSIELVLRDADGNPLTEGTDYTVSYKNNKNAAGPSAGKKTPTLVVSGKGKTYRGLKAEVNFTILPADFKYALVAVNKRFAPFTSAGKISAVITSKLPSGVKIPAGQTEIKYYLDGEELDKNAMKELYKGKEARQVEIRVSAKEPKSGAKNYRIGSLADSVYVTAYPKNSKSLTVKLKNSRQTFSANSTLKVSELCSEILNEDKLKVGRNQVSASSLLPVKAYFDKNLTDPTADDGETIDRAGTYYLCFELNDEAKQQYTVYKPTVVKYVMTGKKVNKGKTKIDAKSGIISFNGSKQNVSVNILIDREKMKAEELLVTYTTRDLITYTGTVGLSENSAKYGKKYDYEIDDTGRLILDDLDNGAKGSYTLTFRAINDYTGSFKLNYKIQ